MLLAFATVIGTFTKPIFSAYFATLLAAAIETLGITLAAVLNETLSKRIVPPVATVVGTAVVLNAPEAW